MHNFIQRLALPCLVGTVMLSIFQTAQAQTGFLALAPAVNQIQPAPVRPIPVTPIPVGPMPINPNQVPEPLPDNFNPNLDPSIAQDLPPTDTIYPTVPEPENGQQNTNSPFGLQFMPKGLVTTWGSVALGRSNESGMNFGVSVPVVRSGSLSLNARGRLDVVGKAASSESSASVNLDALLSAPLFNMEMYGGPTIGTQFGASGRELAFGGMAGLRNQWSDQWGWFAEGQLRRVSGNQTFTPSMRAGVTYRF